MRTIIEALRTGNARERLAIVADVLSIVGISLATVVGGGFALGGTLDVENVVGVVVISLLSLAGASLVLLAFLSASSVLRSRLAANPTGRFFLQLSLWSVFSALFVVAAFFAYFALSHMRFVR